MPDAVSDIYALLAERVRFEQELGQSVYRVDDPLPEHMLRAQPIAAPRTDTAIRPSPVVAAPVSAPAPREAVSSARHLPPVADAEAQLSQLHKSLRTCQACSRHQTRQTVVVGEGASHAALMFVGDAPAPEDDLTGIPFAGSEGSLLNRIIQAMNLQRSQVFLTQLTKCHMPESRFPSRAEMDACGPFLLQQIASVNPRVVVALGQVVARWLLNTDAPITALRGKFHPWNGRLVMPVYSLAYLLQKSDAKKTMWDDMQLVMRELAQPAATETK